MAHATHGVRERIREVLLALRRLVGCDRHCAVFREEIGLAKRFKGQKGDVMYSQLIDARQRRPRRVPCRQRSLAGVHPLSGTALYVGGLAQEALNETGGRTGLSLQPAVVPLVPPRVGRVREAEGRGELHAQTWVSFCCNRQTRPHTFA